MRFKKFFVIPVLIALYFLFVPILAQTVPVFSETKSGASGGSTELVGVNEGVSVVVMRPYLFGLFTLPVYNNSIGDLSYFHTAFFVFVGLMTSFFVAMEWRGRKSLE